MAVSPGLLFWLFVLCLTWRVSGPLDLSTGQHFWKHKLCIDNECSKKQPETKAEEPASATLLKKAIYSTMLIFTKMLSLLYVVHPGPHIYQLPWKPVLLAMSLLLMIVIGRSDLVVKVRVYQDQIKKLTRDSNLLQAFKDKLQKNCHILNLKVDILNELHSQKQIELQKKLSQKEYERQEKEQLLSAAEEKVVLAAEEVKTYKRRIKEMEEELQKTERSFKNQIATHDKKAHDNWLKGRAAERAIAEEKMETANLRHKLLEMTQKMAMRQDEPGIVKPMPGRPNTQNPPQRGPPSQNGSFGPSPMSGGECSPPLTAEPTGRPLSATFNQSDMPRSEFDPGCGPASMNSNSRSSSPAKVMDDGKQTIPQEPEAPSVPTVTSLAGHPVAVNMAKWPPPPFQGVPLIGSPVGRPPPPPFGYGPPFQLGGPFGPRPFPPPFGPGMCPPLGLREYEPGVPIGKRDLPFDPQES